MEIDKEIILENIKEYCVRKGLKHEIHNFDSESIIVDIWCLDLFYVVQIDKNNIGLSDVGDNPAFDSKPDEQFNDSELFIKKFNGILQNQEKHLQKTN